MVIKEINSEELKNLNNEFTVVLFHAVWCAQSKNLRFEINKIEDDTLNFLSFDIDKDINLSKELKINITPTLLIFKEKEILGRRSDLWTKNKGVIKSNLIIEWINSFRNKEV